MELEHIGDIRSWKEQLFNFVEKILWVFMFIVSPE
jgi:hypothetical protein